MNRTGPRLAGIAVGALALVGLAGWLLWPSPPTATALHSGTSRYVVSATIDPPRIGSADVTIDLTARDGSTRPASVRVEAVTPLMGFATPALPAAPSGNAGRYTVSGVPLMMTGPWELHVSIAGPGGNDELTLPFTVSG